MDSRVVISALGLAHQERQARLALALGMTDLRLIDGGKKAKRIAEAKILECGCGCRTFVEARTGILIDTDGKVVHKGTVTRVCANCGKLAQ